MQFEPATFATYANPIPPGGADPASPYDPADAIYAAARYLCSLGIGANPSSALIAYNCGNTGPACQAASASYAAEVMGIASSLGEGGSGPGTLGARVSSYAESQLGVPYQWGAETPGVAFDCSGLAQWAWAQVGVSLPRVAQDQYDAGPQIPISQLKPGDLVYFGPEDGEAVGHVGIYVGDGEMIDAPDTGSVVRYDPIDQFSPALVGAIDPGGGA